MYEQCAALSTPLISLNISLCIYLLSLSALNMEARLLSIVPAFTFRDCFCRVANITLVKERTKKSRFSRA